MLISCLAQVCQERRLSPRVIHFAKDQLFWECESCFLSNCGDQDWRPNSNDSQGRNPIKGQHENPGAGWRNFIRTYSRLQFTKISDRLPALAGIVAREMRERLGDTYIAGMWKSTLLDDLAFYSKHPTPANPGIPTWSWASCRDGVDFLGPKEVRMVKLVRLDFEYDGAVQLGASLAASIRLKKVQHCTPMPLHLHLSPARCPWLMTVFVHLWGWMIVDFARCLELNPSSFSWSSLPVFCRGSTPKRGWCCDYPSRNFDGKFVKVCAERLTFSKLGVTGNEELMEAFLRLFTEREVDIF
jgi:hypothetical protein